MFYKFTRVSSNAKTGPIPVTTTQSKSCPTTCPLYKGCYAKGGPLAIHWKRLDSNGIELKELCKNIMQLPKDQLWRHNQAGDLPGEDTRINHNDLKQIVEANKGRKGFTYTHKPVEDHKYAKANIESIKYANDNGFTINLSANNLSQVDRYLELDAGPVVVVLDENSPKNVTTPKGNKVVICPAQLNNNSTCANCKLCQKKDRFFVIGFKAHGNSRKKVSEIVKE